MSYDAFISYSHAADGKLAPAVQSALQRFAKPWYTLRALRVFRDTTSLTATPQLWDSIERALSDARYFILFASPDAARSEWVEREVRWWLEHKATDRLLICLTDGEVYWRQENADFDWARSTALPPALEGAFAQEPLWVDLAWARKREHLSRSDARFMMVITKLAAPIHGRAPEDMAGEEVRQHRRTRAVAIVAVATIAALAVVAELQRGAAVRERDNAVALVAQISVNNGLSLAARGDSFGALSWSVRALRRDSNNPVRAHEHRVRVGLQLRSLPRLVHAMTLSLPVTDAAFSPDGLLFATATGVSYRSTESEGAAQLWDAISGRPLTAPLAHGGTVYSVDFSPDGARLLTACSDGVARIWDVRTGALLSDDIRIDSVMRLARFSPDGRYLATAGRAAQLWDAQTGAPITEPLGEPDFNAWHIAFSPDGKLLLATYGNAYLDGDAGTARIWDALTGAPRTPSIGMGGPWIYYGSFSPDGTRFVLADGAREAQVFSTDNGRPWGEPVDHGDRVSYAAFSGDGKRMISAGWDGTVRVDTLHDNEDPLQLEVGAPVREAELSPDGRMLVVGSSNGLARVWDTYSGESLSPSLRLSHADYPRRSAFEQGETPGPEFGLAFSPDGRRLVITGWDGTVRVWDLADRATLSAILPASVPAGPFTAAVPVADANATAPVQLAREAGGVRVTEVATGRSVLQAIEAPSSAAQGSFIEQLKYRTSDDGRWIVVFNAGFGLSGWLFVIDTTTFDAHRVDLGGVWPIQSVSFDPDDDRLWVVLGSDFWVKGHTPSDQDFSDVDPGHVRAWQLASGQPATPLLEGSANVKYLQFDPSGQRMIGGQENWLRIWDARTGEALTGRIEHARAITRRVFSADGRYLATASKDASARVWDVTSGAPRTPPLSHRPAMAGWFQEGVLAIAFNDDATWLASAGADQQVRVWNLDTGQSLGPPFRVNFVPQAIAFDPTQQALVVTGRGEQRQVFDISPVELDIDDLALWAEALSARQFDPSEGLMALDGRDVEERLARVKQIPGLSPEPTRLQLHHWHASRASRIHAWQKNEPSAKFHGQQIERIQAGGDIQVRQTPARAPGDRLADSEPGDGSR